MNIKQFNFYIEQIQIKIILRNCLLIKSSEDMKKDRIQQIKQKNKVTINVEPIIEVDCFLEKTNSQVDNNILHSHSRTSQTNNIIICEKYNQQQKKFIRVNNKPQKNGITIAKAKRQLNKPLAIIDPGPMSYETNNIAKVNQSVKFAKSKGHETFIKKDQSKIGPGYYNIQSNKRQTNYQYQLGSKYESYFDTIINKNPGPGDYQIILPQINNKKISQNSHDKGFGSANRFSNQKILPGPGSYNIQIKINESQNKKRTISNGNRDSFCKLQSVPGPGNYQILSSFSQLANRNKGISIGTKNLNFRGEVQLTAQAYNKYEVKFQSQSQYKCPPSFSIGSQKRKFIQIKNALSPRDVNKNHLKIPCHQQNSENRNLIKNIFSKSKSISLLNLNQNKSVVRNISKNQEFTQNLRKSNINQSIMRKSTQCQYKSKKLIENVKKSFENSTMLRQIKMNKIRI